MEALSITSLGIELDEALAAKARVDAEIRRLGELPFGHKLPQSQDRLVDEIADLRLMISEGTPKSDAEVAIVVANAHHAMREALRYPKCLAGMEWAAKCTESAARAMYAKDFY